MLSNLFFIARISMHKIPFSPLELAERQAIFYGGTSSFNVSRSLSANVTNRITKKTTHIIMENATNLVRINQLQSHLADLELNGIIEQQPKIVTLEWIEQSIISRYMLSERCRSYFAGKTYMRRIFC